MRVISMGQPVLLDGFGPTSNTYINYRDYFVIYVDWITQFGFPHYFTQGPGHLLLLP